jgi:tetratricopeptide (TPR) repeat protein
MSDSQDLLQHPRRNLGNRYRSTAQKFAKLANADPQRSAENLGWAEQNARQAILHDFTDERNWRCLAELKVLNNDAEGLHAVLEDVFVVLGRDPEHVNQLRGIDFITHGRELLEAAFVNDSLDPDSWWTQIVARSSEGALEDFVSRCRRLDFRDQRANIVFGRRLERIRSAGHESIFIELAQHLLAHRPTNHELWLELGRLHERRGEIDHAWSCYDQVQQWRPHNQERDRFLERLKGNMDGKEQQAWSGPSIEHREAFLRGMQVLTERISTTVSAVNQPQLLPELEPIGSHPDEQKLTTLCDQGDFQAAFFLVRRLLANGETWAEPWLERIQSALK